VLKENVMRRLTRLLTITILLLLPGVSIAGARFARFDGKWQTTVSCDASRGALGFSYRFISVVKNGSFHGLRGTENEPGYLLVDGTIDEDGVGKLYAQGKTGSKEFVPGVDTPRGTDFGYHVNANFDERHGTGVRVEGRHCSYEFEKQ
jgi:hypothetical protein